MRPLIALATITGIVTLSGTAAGPPKKEDIPKLITVLKSSPNAKDRVQAADDIAYRGSIRASDVDIAIEPLVVSLRKDGDPTVQSACAKAIGNIGTNPEKCVPALADSLKDAAEPVKIAAIKSLGQFGPEAASALPALRDLASKKDDKKVSAVAAAAAKSIAGIEKKKK